MRLRPARSLRAVLFVVSAAAVLVFAACALLVYHGPAPIIPMAPRVVPVALNAHLVPKLIIQRTTVDMHRFPERVAVIVDTFADPAQVPEHALPAVFVSGDTPASAMPHNAQVFVPASKHKFVQLYEAIRVELASAPAREWFFKMDDVTFVRPSALVQLAQSYGVSRQPLLFGKRLGLGKGDKVFVSGGAGFLFNRATARAFVDAYERHCGAAWAKSAFHLRSEDVAFAQCLDEQAGVRSTALSGEDRFHAIEPADLVLTAERKDWLADYSRAAGEPLRTGLECCHAASVSFHYCEAGLQRLLFDALELGRCPASPEALLRDYPAHLGGYARKPKTHEDAVVVWSLLRKLAACGGATSLEAAHRAVSRD